MLTDMDIKQAIAGCGGCDYGCAACDEAEAIEARAEELLEELREGLSLRAAPLDHDQREMRANVAAYGAPW
jgi:organic radical activating enzyme